MRTCKPATRHSDWRIFFVDRECHCSFTDISRQVKLSSASALLDEEKRSVFDKSRILPSFCHSLFIGRVCFDKNLVFCKSCDYLWEMTPFTHMIPKSLTQKHQKLLAIELCYIFGRTKNCFRAIKALPPFFMSSWLRVQNCRRTAPTPSFVQLVSEAFGLNPPPWGSLCMIADPNQPICWGIMAPDWLQ